MRSKCGRWRGRVSLPVCCVGWQMGRREGGAVLRERWKYSVEGGMVSEAALPAKDKRRAG